MALICPHDHVFLGMVRSTHLLSNILASTWALLGGDRSWCCSAGGRGRLRNLSVRLVAARYIGRLAALVTALMLFVVAYELAIGNFMTESFGVPLGLFALTLLLAYAGGQRHTAVLYAGLALFSIAMFGRMGALFTLPLLALWACVEVFRSGAKHKIVLCLGAFVAVAAGPILQVLLVLLLGVYPPIRAPTIAC